VTRQRCRDLLPVIVRGREIRDEGTPRVERIVNEKKIIIMEVRRKDEVSNFGFRTGEAAAATDFILACLFAAYVCE